MMKDITNLSQDWLRLSVQYDQYNVVILVKRIIM